MLKNTVCYHELHVIALTLPSSSNSTFLVIFFVVDLRPFFVVVVIISFIVSFTLRPKTATVISNIGTEQIHYNAYAGGQLLHLT